ncbi:hypothetical protein [Pasteuria penetrans]|uniref:hypothetical protein n=1 Tax=Pasteuria penetrans TaxID=86005 RepID=UPI0011EF688C|nr:hypothetical protein [Pasteuria penetrans]
MNLFFQDSPIGGEDGIRDDPLSTIDSLVSLTEIMQERSGDWYSDAHPYIRDIGNINNTSLYRKIASISLALKSSPPLSPFLYVLHQQHMLLQWNTSNAWRPPQHSSSKRWGQKGKKRTSVGEKVRWATVRPKRRDGISLYHTWICHQDGLWYGETQEAVDQPNTWIKNVALRGQRVWRDLYESRGDGSGLTWLKQCIWVGNHRLGSEENRMFLQNSGQKFIVQRSHEEPVVQRMMQYAGKHPQFWHSCNGICRVQNMGEWETGLQSVVLSFSRNRVPIPHQVLSTNVSLGEELSHWFHVFFRWQEKMAGFVVLPLWKQSIDPTHVATASHRRGYSILLYLYTLLLERTQCKS